MSLTFSALPTNRTHSTPVKYLAEADELRANRGAWALFNLPDSMGIHPRSSLAHNIRTGKLKAFRDGDFEARIINGDLWVRNV